MPANCVAFGCTNYYYGKGTSSSFFRFPSEKTYPARRAAWIAAVKRVNPDGTPWQPNRHSRICGAHFITGRPSIFKDHPDYVPTVFAYSKSRRNRVTNRLERKRHAVAEEKAMNDPGGEPADVEQCRDPALAKDQQDSAKNVKRLKKTALPSRNTRASSPVSPKRGPAQAKQRDTKYGAKRRRPSSQEGDGEGAPPDHVVSVYVMDEVHKDPVSAMVQAECTQGRMVFDDTPRQTVELSTAPVTLSDRKRSIASMLADFFVTADRGVQAGITTEDKTTQVPSRLIKEIVIQDKTTQVPARWIKKEAAIQDNTTQAPSRLTKEAAIQVGPPSPEANSVRTRKTADKEVLVNTKVFVPKFVDNLDDQNVKYFTGLPSMRVLKALTLCYERARPPSIRHHFASVERIVMTLMKLRHNFNNAFIRALFHCSFSNCALMMAQAIPILAEIFRPLVYLPPREETTKSTPDFFKELRNVRVIIGCMQVPLSQPESLLAAYQCHSHDRKEFTAKYLMAVTTSGLIAHVSQGYGGQASDSEVFERSGLIELLDVGSDAIMADHTFAIDELCEDRDIELVRPIGKKRPQRREGAPTNKPYQILSSRVHVERVAHGMKQFKILSAGVPWATVEDLDEIMIVAAGITNLSVPVIGPHLFV